MSLLTFQNFKPLPPHRLSRTTPPTHILIDKRVTLPTPLSSSSSSSSSLLSSSNPPPIHNNNDRGPFSDSISPSQEQDKGISPLLPTNQETGPPRFLRIHRGSTSTDPHKKTTPHIHQSPLPYSKDNTVAPPNNTSLNNTPKHTPSSPQSPPNNNNNNNNPKRENVANNKRKRSN